MPRLDFNLDDFCCWLSGKSEINNLKNYPVSYLLHNYIESFKSTSFICMIIFLICIILFLWNLLHILIIIRPSRYFWISKQIKWHGKHLTQCSWPLCQVDPQGLIWFQILFWVANYYSNLFWANYLLKCVITFKRK